jgi:hypothetical protein
MGIPNDFSRLEGRGDMEFLWELFDGKNLLNPESNKQTLGRTHDSHIQNFSVLSTRDTRRLKVSSKQILSLLLEQTYTSIIIIIIMPLSLTELLLWLLLRKLKFSFCLQYFVVSYSLLVLTL